MWERVVEPYRPQMAIWRMTFECLLPKATNTHSEYVIRNAFPLQERLHERPLMFVIHTVSVLFIYCCKCVDNNWVLKTASVRLG